jgi:hypothetical protein
MAKVANGCIPHGMDDNMAKAALVVLLNKEANEIEQLRRTMGDDCSPPSRFLAILSTFSKLACNCILIAVRSDVVNITGQEQLAVGCKGGCESLQ